MTLEGKGPKARNKILEGRMGKGVITEWAGSEHEISGFKSRAQCWEKMVGIWALSTEGHVGKSYYFVKCNRSGITMEYRARESWECVRMCQTRSRQATGKCLNPPLNLLSSYSP